MPTRGACLQRTVGPLVLYREYDSKVALWKADKSYTEPEALPQTWLSRMVLLAACDRCIARSPSPRQMRR